MNRMRSSWLLIAFITSFFIVGVPYWLIPYNKVNLPDALIGPGLFVVAIATMVLRLYGVTPFWKAVGIIGASVPAAVFARVIVDGFKDPTSHNLWPLEIIIALVMGFFCAMGGAIVGNLLAKARQTEIRLD